MTDEEMERFVLELKESERIRALIAREEAALSNGEHDHGIPMAAAPPEQPASVLLAPDLRISETGAARR
jgi:hypothetical protein